ncbi:hypothetical protein D3C86_234160 [compost metagenome]
MRQQVFGDGPAVIDDAQFDGVVRLRGPDDDRLARRAMLARVAHQVGDDLRHAVGVGHQGQAGGHVGLDAQARIGLALFLDQAVDQPGQVAQPLFDAQPEPPLQAGQVQHLRNQPLHPAAGVADAFAHAGARVCLGQQGGGHRDGLQRVAQIVAQHRQQGGARPIHVDGAAGGDVGQFVAQVVGGFQFGGQPRRADTPHDFLPGLERTPRRQPRPQAAHGILFFRLAAPYDGFDLLLAQPDQPAVVHGVELARQQARVRHQIGLQFWIVASDVGGVDQALAALVQGAKNAGQFTARRDAAEHRHAVAPEAKRGIAGDQRRRGLFSEGQRLRHVFRGGHALGQLADQPGALAGLFGAFAAFDIGQGGGQHLR